MYNISNSSDYYLEVGGINNKQYKRSRQRERILELLESTGTHPPADWLYAQLKADFPNLSMGTVYRNLSILIEQGRIQRIEFGSTFDRFDANMSEHYHFICDSCGSVVDLDLPIDKRLEQMVADTTVHKPSRHRIEFYGLCGECRSKE